MSVEEVALILDRLTRIERLIVDGKTVKEWYTTGEVAGLLERDPYTVREWARLGRIRAEKRPCGRGRTKEWVVSHDELQRIRNHGLLSRG